MSAADRSPFVMPVEPPPGTGPTLAVKDNIAVGGLPFTAGLALFAERRGAADADVVARLRAAGARLNGVTHTDAAGLGVLTPAVVNPRDPARVAGGSSGGSAAAVAAGLADLGLGTDTGGSVRIPAACCGVFGLKPSHGAVPMQGVWPLCPAFDGCGPLARSLDRLAWWARAVLGIAPEAETRPSRPASLGYDPHRLARSAPETAAAIRSALEMLERAGHPLHEVALPPREAVLRAHGQLVLAAAAEIYRDHWPERADAFPEPARQALAAATRLTPDDIASARESVGAAQRELAGIFAQVELVLSPAIPVPPPRREQSRTTLDGRATPVRSALISEACLANVAGAPALAMPYPGASLQLMAAPGRDAALLGLGRDIAELLAIDADTETLAAPPPAP